MKKAKAAENGTVNRVAGAVPAPAEPVANIVIPKPNVIRLSLRIRGISPLIVCRFDTKARVLIHSVRASYSADSGPSLAYLSVRVKGEDDGRAYLPSSVVLSDDEYRRQAMADAGRYLDGFAARFRHLEELADVIRAIEEFRRRNRKDKGD